MKRILTLCMLACSICMLAIAQEQTPQGKQQLTPEEKAQRKEHRAQQLEAEKIAFITKAVDITPEEAGAFWALYNKLEKEQKDLVSVEKEAFKALNIALRAKNEDGTPSTPDAEIEKLLIKYLNAKKANTDIHAAHINDYKKVVGVRKTAKFFSAQERFRRQQINKLSGQGGHNGQHPGGQRGQGGQYGPQSGQGGQRGYNPEGR